MPDPLIDPNNFEQEIAPVTKEVRKACKTAQATIKEEKFNDREIEKMYRYWRYNPMDLRSNAEVCEKFKIEPFELIKIKKKHNWEHKVRRIHILAEEEQRQELVRNRISTIGGYIRDLNTMQSITSRALKNASEYKDQIKIKSVDDLLKLSKINRELHEAQLNIIDIYGSKMNPEVVEVIMEDGPEGESVFDLMLRFESHGVIIPKAILEKARSHQESEDSKRGDVNIEFVLPPSFDDDVPDKLINITPEKPSQSKK